jgi:predicted ATPase
MYFILSSDYRAKPTSPTDVAYLLIDNWDDYGYKTAFALHYVDETGEWKDIGWVKIAKFGMQTGKIYLEMPEHFEILPQEFFSLGQSQDYYSALNALGEEKRRTILRGLRDLAQDQKLLARVLAEDVTNISLLRSTSLVSVKGQFGRLAQGQSSLSAFTFEYHRPTPPGSANPPPPLTFEVIPDSKPPTNIHVLIGRNGVGKSHCFYTMAMTILASSQSEERGKFVENSSEDANEVFASLVFVSFSLFDTGLIYNILAGRDPKARMNFEFIGFDVPPEIPPTEIAPRVIELQFADQFADALATCKLNNSLDRWKRTMKGLESDPLMAELGFQELEASEGQEWIFEAKQTFKSLSSGHKIICLTMTQLVARVAERTLVLIDEPESHLHPPLLSAYIRALSELLIDQNGVAIIATHSPVVLQEVPAECVWVPDRSGNESSASRPASETFGENVAALTRDVFRLEVVQAGYNKLLQDAVDEFHSYDATMAHFAGKLGSEARAIIRGLTAVKDSEND